VDEEAIKEYVAGRINWWEKEKVKEEKIVVGCLRPTQLRSAEGEEVDARIIEVCVENFCLSNREGLLIIRLFIVKEKDKERVVDYQIFFEAY